MEWMAWTWPTAMFFAGIVFMVAGMTVWQVLRPTIARRGLLPLVTKRGDRLFIGLLSSAYIHLAWIALLPTVPLWVATIFSTSFIAFLLRWG